MKARLVPFSQFLVVKKEVQQVGRTLEGGNERSKTPFLAFRSPFIASLKRKIEFLSGKNVDQFSTQLRK